MLPLDLTPRPRPSAAAAVIRWVLAGLAVLWVAWASLRGNGWVPFLSGVDLGVHEFGHLLTMWAPPLLMSLAGSALQVGAPAALAGYFWWRGDRLGAVLLTGWVGMSLHNVSVYIRDASAGVLPLFGDDGTGSGHDWRNILGELGILHRSGLLADLVRSWAVVAFAASIVLAAILAVAELRAARAHQRDPLTTRPGS